jgi:hypothetical protein
MGTLLENPIVTEKHRVQKAILEEAGGDLREYSRIVKREAEKLRRDNPGKYTKIHHENSNAAA